MSKTFTQLLLKKRVTLSKIAYEVIDDLGVFSGLAADAGSVVDHNHGQYG